MGLLKLQRFILRRKRLGYRKVVPTGELPEDREFLNDSVFCHVEDLNPPTN